MTKEQIMKFIVWLKARDMKIAGYTYSVFLGTDQLAPLDEEDYENVINDFIKDQS